MPIISVIVPVYKVEPYLRRCVDSILQQSFTDFELILVDDGSPDNCPAICDEYAVHDKRVHVIHQKNGGLSAARNAGIDWSFQHSDSEWITFVDSDDWVHEHYLKWMYETAVSMNVQLCMCGYQNIKKGHKPLPTGMFSFQKVYTENLYECPIDTVHTISSCSKLYLKCQWENIRFPVGKLHEDRFTTHKLIFQNEVVAVIPQQLYYYYLSDESIMRSPWTPHRLDDLEAVQEQLDFFKKHGLMKPWKNMANSHLFILYSTISVLEEIAPQYSEYIPALKKQLKRVLHIYKKAFPIPIAKYGYIYDMAYPFWMRQYWRLQKALRLLHLREK